MRTGSDGRRLRSTEYNAGLVLVYQSGCIDE